MVSPDANPGSNDPGSNDTGSLDPNRTPSTAPPPRTWHTLIPGSALRATAANTALVVTIIAASTTGFSAGTLALTAITAAVVTWASGILREITPTRPIAPQSPWAPDGPVAATLETLNTATIVANAQGSVVIANAQAQTYLSPRRPIVGRSLDEIFTKAEILDLIASARRGVARTADVRVPTPEGASVLEVLAAALPDEVASGLAPAPDTTTTEVAHAIVVAVRDVTDLSLAVQLKTDFVANASHELRTPISAIRAAVDTLAVAGEDLAMRERLLDMIDRHTMRLDELVRDLLDLSKLESPDAPVRIRDVRASEIAQELAEGFATSLSRRGVTLRFDLPGAFEHLRTDRRILMLILKNLIENAIKFAESGTEVLVEGEVIPPIVEEGHPDDSPGARFRVVDRGEGIPLHQQQRIFERFYQGDEARSGEPRTRGTGLGLSIVKHGVRALGGNVSVDSVWQKGTTMTVDLPATLPAQATSTAETAQTAGSVDRHSHTPAPNVSGSD